jgi:TPR repeat protein
MMRGNIFRICLLFILLGTSAAYGDTDAVQKKPLTLMDMYKMNSADLLRRPDATAEEDYLAGQIALSRGEIVEAQGMFERAAKKGHTGAMVKYADILARAGFMKDAIESYRQAANLGDPAGQFNLGAMYLDLGNYDWKNLDSKANDVEARKWIMKAAEQDYPDAVNLIASIYASGGMGLTDAERTNAEILKWLHKSADLGTGTAMDKLSEAYTKGLFGLSVDQKLADEWAAKAKKVYGVKEIKQKKIRKKRL